MDLSQAELRKRRAAIDPRPTGIATWALRPAYRMYEGWLARQVQEQPVPRHIGIILDGNRRHAERHGLTDPCEIYALGAGKLDDVLDWCG